MDNIALPCNTVNAAKVIYVIDEISTVHLAYFQLNTVCIKMYELKHRVDFSNNSTIERPFFSESSQSSLFL